MAESGLGEGGSRSPKQVHFGSKPARSALQLLDAPDRPTAIFAYNDIAAMGVYHAARRLGLSIPHDLSVVGFGDYENVASELCPALTTMGAAAPGDGSSWRWGRCCRGSASWRPRLRPGSPASSAPR